MENKDLTTAQVAGILGIHRNTVSKLVKDGKLKPYRITEGTGRMRFTLEEIENFKRNSDVKQIQPKGIIEEHSLLVNFTEIPEMLSNFFTETERAEFKCVLEVANIEAIFGRFLKNASNYDYSESLRGKSNIWIGETFLNLLQGADKKGKINGVLYKRLCMKVVLKMSILKGIH